MIRIKSGPGAARIVGLQPCMVIAAMVCDSVMATRDLDAVITCGIDGKHMKSSKHYVGLAFDLRSNTLGQNQQLEVCAEIKGALGDDFDVVVEGDHLHIEADPKTPING